MLRNFLLLFSISLSVLVYSQQFQSAVIEMKNGTKKTGLVSGKSLSNAKQFKFKSAEDAREETIPNAGVESVEFSSGSDKVYRLDNISFYTTPKKNAKESSWMLHLVSGYYELYTLADFSFDKKGNLILSSNYLAARTLPEFYYFIRKQGDPTAEILGIHSPSPNYFGLHKILKEGVNRFMADDTALVAKVEKKQLTTKHIEQIVKSYNEFKSKP